MWHTIRVTWFPFGLYHVLAVGNGSLGSMGKEQIIYFGSPTSLPNDTKLSRNARFLVQKKLLICCFGINLKIVLMLTQQRIGAVPSSLALKGEINLLIKPYFVI